MKLTLNYKDKTGDFVCLFNGKDKAVTQGNIESILESINNLVHNLEIREIEFGLEYQRSAVSNAAEVAGNWGAAAAAVVAMGFAWAAIRSNSACKDAHVRYDDELKKMQDFYHKQGWGAYTSDNFNTEYPRFQEHIKDKEGATRRNKMMCVGSAALAGTVYTSNQSHANSIIHARRILNCLNRLLQENEHIQHIGLTCLSDDLFEGELAEVNTTYPEIPSIANLKTVLRERIGAIQEKGDTMPTRSNKGKTPVVDDGEDALNYDDVDEDFDAGLGGPAAPAAP